MNTLNADSDSSSDMVSVRFKGKVYTAEKFHLIQFDGKAVTEPTEPQILDLSGLGIEFISEIEGLDEISDSDLDQLWLSGNPIEKIDSLDGFSKLKMIDFSRCGLTQISGLDNLVSLEEIDLTGNKIIHISGLEKLVRLRFLSLSSNQIERITGLSNLANLEAVQMYANNIHKIEGLENLQSLRYLDLSWNRIAKIEGLENLSNLEHLLLMDTDIEAPDGWKDWCTQLNIDGVPAEEGNAQGAVEYCRSLLG